jgi:micrococcal nuclease
MQRYSTFGADGGADGARGGLAGGMRAVTLMLVAAALGVAGCGAGDEGPAPAGKSVQARVVRVVDGDTIVARVGGEDAYVRYIGVDTPESVKPGTPVECFGRQASAENHRLVEGRTVRLVFDRELEDAYGRLLAYVYTGAGSKGSGGRRFVNATLVRLGYARTLTIAPNTAHAGLFDRLEARAGQAGRGLWGAC